MKKSSFFLPILIIALGLGAACQKSETTKINGQRPDAAPYLVGYPLVNIQAVPKRHCPFGACSDDFDCWRDARSLGLDPGKTSCSACTFHGCCSEHRRPSVQE